MRPSGLERRLVVGVLVLCLVPTVVAGGVLLLLRREGLLETPASLFTAVLLGVPALMIYLALSVWTIGRSLVRAVHDIQIGTELMAGVNPNHRLAVETGDELQAVASQINRLADGLAVARHGLELEVARDTYTVYVRPELVVEIAVNEIQESPHYPGGMALRFARVKRYRPDKTPEQADSIETVRSLFARAVLSPSR